MSTYEQTTQDVRDAFDALCRGRVEAAVKAEREACAKVADRFVGADPIAAAIRSRGQA